MIAAAGLMLAAAAAAAAAPQASPAESVAARLAGLGARPLPGRELVVPFDVAPEGGEPRQSGQNVVAWLPASGSATGTPTGPYVVLGAHLDEAGAGAAPAATVLAAAEALARKPAALPVVVAFWSDRPPGLDGSSRFLADRVVAPGDVFAYVHVGAIGPAPDNRLRIEGVASSPVWGGLIERTNVAAGFDISVRDSPYLPADSTTFYLAGVASVSLSTGEAEAAAAAADAGDTPERVARFAAALVRNLARGGERPRRVEVAREPPEGVARPTGRAFTGTVPDYAAEVDGLRLGGVIAGGPAAQAGLREGDVIVEMAGRTIRSVVDYAEVLEGLAPGHEVPVVYLRDGERHEATITPGSR